MISKFLWLLAAASLAAFSQPAAAEDIRVVVSGGFAAAYKELSVAFEKRTQHRLITGWGASMGSTPTAIPVRLERGEAIDVVIMAREGLEPLLAKGRVVPGSEADLVRSKIAMAVREGAPAPDISSVEALRRTLLNARSIAYSDSASGVYLSGDLFKRLGIDQQIAGKSRMIHGTPVGETVARGEAEIGFQQYSELLPVKGIRIVGLIPEETQKVTVFAAGVTTNAKAPVGARALIEFLASPDAYSAIRASGLEPAGEPRAE